MIPIRDLIDNAIAAAVEGQADEAAEAVITAGELIDELATSLKRIHGVLTDARKVAKFSHAHAVERKLFEALLLTELALSKCAADFEPPAPNVPYAKVIDDLNRQLEAAKYVRSKFDELNSTKGG